MSSTQNGPDATGESQERWTQRSDAWLAGHDLQSAMARLTRRGADARGEETPAIRS